MGRIVALLNLLITFSLLMAPESYLKVVSSQELTGSEFFSSINEAKQKVDKAYTLSRERIKESLNGAHLSPSDFLKYLKAPVAGTRTAIRAANYVEAALNILKKKMQNKCPRPFNITGMMKKVGETYDGP
ncbi:myeloperoxidase-like [Python bivittatus]|uniref:Myeloperoxidase-like n=1 Tax=Python bivittatus TaxID=176946 RepID=A0A9F5IX62_PYTBI|nr:myeloperoxidase-like [Python bivittatus]